MQRPSEPRSAIDLLGAVFFRVRSFAPLPVIVLIVVLSWREHIEPGPGGDAVDGALNLVGLALAVLGAAMRFVTIGLVPPGTVSQSRRFTAATLNTSGPYAVVRHPLYLGNFFIVTGLLCIAHTPWGWTIGLGWFLGTTFLIVRAEEALLARTFGAAYEEWAGRVSAWLPKPSALRELRGPFGWKRAIQREVNPLVGWGLGATALIGWEWFARGRLDRAHLGLIGYTALALLLLLVLNKLWKKGTR